MEKSWERHRRRLFEIVEVGNDIDWISRGYDFLNTFVIILNLAVSIMYTFEYGQEESIHFIKIQLTQHDPWVGKNIFQLGLPEKVIVAVIKRNHQILIPHGDTVLNANDTIVLGAESFNDREHINLKEIVLQKHNPWNGQRIRDLDISRKTIIILVKRKNKALIPNGNMILREGDTIILYTQMHLANMNNLEIDIEI